MLWIGEKVKDDARSRFLPANIRKIATPVLVRVGFSVAKLTAARFLRKRGAACDIEVTRIQGKGHTRQSSQHSAALPFCLQCLYTIFIARNLLLNSF